MILRPYQQKLNDDIYDAWDAGHRRVGAVMVTGAGKTVAFTQIIKEHVGYSILLVHRVELLEQACLTLSKRGVKHNIIAPQSTIKNICRSEVTEFGKCYYDPNASAYVASVPTLVRRLGSLNQLCSQVTLVVVDECHHLTDKNSFGRCVLAFTNAKTLGVTATLCRASSSGLGAGQGGLLDTFVEGPTMKWLINNGYLCDYVMYAPESYINMTNVNITSSGDYSQKKLSAAIEDSTIVGDVVKSYLKFGKMRPGITFTVSVKNAHDISDAYIKAGVSSAVLHAELPQHERHNILRKMRNGELNQVVNCGILTEGSDIKIAQVISFARKTESLSLYLQMAGRVLRVSPNGEKAILIDHCSNIVRHGAPDEIRTWSLDRRGRKSNTPDDVTLISVCPACSGAYERMLGRTCPYCGHFSEPVDRVLPENVEGELSLLTPEALNKLRADIAQANRTPDEVFQDMQAMNMSQVVCNTNRKRQTELLELRKRLTETIQKWGEGKRSLGQDDTVSYREFWITYGVDVMSAQMLNRKDTEVLIDKVFRGVLPPQWMKDAMNLI